MSLLVWSQFECLRVSPKGNGLIASIKINGSHWMDEFNNPNHLNLETMRSYLPDEPILSFDYIYLRQFIVF
jgi:hypothetical protein